MNTPTVDSIADMVRCAYVATYYRDMSNYAARNVAGEIMSKPVGSMPHYLKDWLRQCGSNANETVLWLKTYL
jgi:hypothetical protein